jgi:hypothetical protein
MGLRAAGGSAQPQLRDRCRGRARTYPHDNAPETDSILQRAAHWFGATIENVGVNHRGLDIFVPEQFPQGIDNITRLI